MRQLKIIQQILTVLVENDQFFNRFLFHLFFVFLLLTVFQHTIFSVFLYSTTAEHNRKQQTKNNTPNHALSFFTHFTSSPLFFVYIQSHNAHRKTVPISLSLECIFPISPLLNMKSYLYFTVRNTTRQRFRSNNYFRFAFIYLQYFSLSFQLNHAIFFDII